MAITGSSRPSITEELARQHLDDLDQLMQRMLALPVDAPNHEAASLNTATADAVFRFEEPSATLIETETEPTAVAKPATMAGKSAVAEEPSRQMLMPDETALAAKVTAIACTSPNGPVIQTIARRGPSNASLPLRLIVAVNRAVEGCAGHFGPPGRWLAGAQGKTFLGWTGLAFLLAAVGWVLVESLGWTW
jgi:hypothetical protein